MEAADWDRMFVDWLGKMNIYWTPVKWKPQGPLSQAWACQSGCSWMGRPGYGSGILAELVWLFQVVKVETTQVASGLGLWCRDTRKEGGGKHFCRPHGEWERCSRSSVTLATSFSPLETAVGAGIPASSKNFPPLWYLCYLCLCSLTAADWLFFSAALWPLLTAIPCSALCFMLPLCSLLILCVLYLEILKNKELVWEWALRVSRNPPLRLVYRWLLLGKFWHLVQWESPR